MAHDAVLGRELGCGHVPRLRGRRDEHRARTRIVAAQHEGEALVVHDLRRCADKTDRLRIGAVGEIKPLFEARAITDGGYSYDVSLDGQRFLVNALPQQTTTIPATIVVNWTAELRK